MANELKNMRNLLEQLKTEAEHLPEVQLLRSIENKLKFLDKKIDSAIKHLEKISDFELKGIGKAAEVTTGSKLEVEMVDLSSFLSPEILQVFKNVNQNATIAQSHDKEGNVVVSPIISLSRKCNGVNPTTEDLSEFSKLIEDVYNVSPFSMVLSPPFKIKCVKEEVVKGIVADIIAGDKRTKFEENELFAYLGVYPFVKDNDINIIQKELGSRYPQIANKEFLRV